MKQRLGVAQALVNAPRLLLLDEPTSALDPMGRKDLLDMIASLRGRTTVFFSTHILGDVERVCDAVAILDRGTVVVQSPIAELKAALRRAEGRRRGDRRRGRARRGDRRSVPGPRAVERGPNGADRGHRDRRRRAPSTRSRRWSRSGTRPGPHGGRRDGPRRGLRRARRRWTDDRRSRCSPRKETREILRTWRRWVLPGIVAVLRASPDRRSRGTPRRSSRRSRVTSSAA